MKKIDRFIYAVISLTLLLNAGAQAIKADDKVLKIYKEDNGEKIRVNVGDSIQLQLEYPGGTGYSWYLDQLDSKHIALSHENTNPEGTTRILGAPVSMTWKFEARSKGRTSVNLYLYRVWEGKEKAIDAFKIDIEIN